MYIYLEIIEFFVSSAAFLWCRNRSDFSNGLKGKVWIVHCQIKSRSTATQHLANEIQITVWSCAMNLVPGISLYKSDCSNRREHCAHFLKLKSLLGAAGSIAAGCLTKGFYFVMYSVVTQDLNNIEKIKHCDFPKTYLIYLHWQNNHLWLIINPFYWVPLTFLSFLSYHLFYEGCLSNCSFTWLH